MNDRWENGRYSVHNDYRTGYVVVSNGKEEAVIDPSEFEHAIDLITAAYTAGIEKGTRRVPIF